MGNQIWDDRKESESFEEFQKYQSFDPFEGFEDEIPGQKSKENSGLETEILEKKTLDRSTPLSQPTSFAPIDSRSFTHTEADWQRIQEEEASVNYVEPAVSWYEKREKKPQNFFRVLLAFLVSLFASAIFVVINVLVYKIEYFSTIQMMMTLLPQIALFYAFYFVNDRYMTTVQGWVLILYNAILSFLMFYAVLAYNIQKEYPVFTFQEAWRAADVMRHISGAKKMYYIHFFCIFVFDSLIGIPFGLSGIRGYEWDWAKKRRSW